MRHYIYISFLAILSMFCFAQASGQAVTTVGANRLQDTTLVKSQMVIRSLATSNENLFIRVTATGQLILDTAGTGTNYIAGYGIVIDEDTISIDSALLNGLYLTLGDSVVTFVTPYQLAQVISAIPPVDLTGIRDTTSALYDSVASLRDDINNIPPPVTPTWQQTLNQDNEGDSVLISDNLFIGTNGNKKPVVLELWSDSRGVPAYVDTRYGWAQVVCNLLGWTLDNKSGAGCMFMSQTPLNPNGCGPNFIDALPTIRDVSGITDTIFITVSERGFNDAGAFNNSGFTNYSPTNFGTSYRTAMDALIAKGRTSNGNKVVIVTPPWIPRIGISGEIATIKRFGDTAKTVGTQYGVDVFDAFAWMRDHSTFLDFLPDSVHERLSGYGVRAEGFLNFIKYQILRDTQKLASNGQAEFNDIKFRLSADTSDGRPNVVGVNSKGDGVILTDAFPRLYDGITDTGDGGNLNLAGQINARDARLRNLVTFGTGISVLDGLSILRAFTAGPGTIWSRNGFSTFSNVATGTAGRAFLNATSGGATINSGSDDMSGMDVQLKNTVSASGFALLSGAPTYPGTLGWHSQIWTSPTFGLIINVRNNSTSTAGDILFGQTGVGGRSKFGYLTIPAYTSAKAAIEGGLFASDTLNINRNLYVGPDGKIKGYGGTRPIPLNSIPVGDGVDMELATLTAGTGIGITNTGGVLTIRTDTTTAVQNLWYTETTPITSNTSRTLTRGFSQFYVDATSGNVTLALTFSYANQTVHVTRNNAAGNTITVTGPGGFSSTALSTADQNLQLFYNGTNVRIQ